MSKYVVISSKDSSSLYPTNSCHNFRVKLGQRLELDGFWQVACVRFSFTQSMCSFHRTESIYLVNYLTQAREVEIQVAPQRFDSIEHLVKTINATLKQEVNTGVNDRLPGLVIDKFGKIYAYQGKLNNKRYLVQFSEGLSLILGLERGGFHYIRAFQTDLYLYLDCISSRTVGDANVQLLTTIDIGNIKSEPGNQSIVHIKSPEYCKVVHSSIDEIEVQVLTDSGIPPIWEYGNVTLTLHFKQLK